MPARSAGRRSMATTALTHKVDGGYAWRLAFVSMFCIGLGGGAIYLPELALYLGYMIPLGFLGNAATFTPAMNNIQGWFDRRRSTAVSIVSVGPAVSGFVWPQIYRWLLPEVGWRETLV